MNAHDPDSKRRTDASDSPAERYLWDASGPRDESIASLEKTLSPLRWRPQPLMAARRVQPLISRSTLMPLRAAAVLALLIAGTWLASVFRSSVESVDQLKSQRNTMMASATMTVRAVAGSPRIDGRAFESEGAIAAGQWIETDEASSALVAVADYGTVEIDPASRLRLVHARADEQRLELAQGSLSAFVTAPPRLFIIDTPAAAAVDLGCAYRLNVDESGNGDIEVTLGWVSMENHGFESLVPRGGKCLTRKSKGVGTPFFGDASAALIEALERFDFDGGSDTAMAIVLREAAVRDTLTLWHLLQRTSGAARGRVFDRLAELTPPPTEATRDRVIAGDQQAIDDWRDALVWSPNLPRLKSR